MIANLFFLQEAPQGSFFGSLTFPLLILVIFYFFIIMPKFRQQKKERNFTSSLTKGTKVVTSSGIHGKVVEINDNDGTVTLETGAGKIKFERAAISMELSKKYATAVKK